MKTGLFHFNLSKHAFIAFLGAMLFLMAEAAHEKRENVSR